MSDEKSNFINNDLSKMFANNSSDLFDYLNNREYSAFNDTIYSKVGSKFLALCISDHKSDHTAQISSLVDYSSVEKYVIKFVFYGEDSFRNGLLYQDPLSTGLTEQQRKIYSNLSKNAIVTDHVKIVGYGDILVVSISPEGTYYVDRVLGNINQPTPPVSGDTDLSKLWATLAQYGGGGGAPLGGSLPNLPLNFDAAAVKPFKQSLGRASKTDGTFKTDACKKCLREKSPFYNLKRLEKTYFYQYKAEDVMNSMLFNKPEFHVAATVWAFMGIEQPKFNFPNNNPGGIQTDGGMFRGTSLSDYDYQTCYRDRVQFRAFAGFNTLPRAMKIKNAIVAAKYASSKGWLMIDPSQSIEEITFNMCRNYYIGWNPMPKDCLSNVEKGLPCFTVDKNGERRDRLKSYNSLKSTFKSKVNQLMNYKPKE